MTGGQVKNKKAIKEAAFGLLKSGTAVNIMASGYSMFPIIKPGDIITINPIPDIGSLIPGCIIAWQRENDFVVHRLIHITDTDKGKHFLTRGDSTLSSDQPVSADQLAGEVVAIEHRGRTIQPERLSFIPEWRYRFYRRWVWFMVRMRRGH